MAEARTFPAGGAPVLHDREEELERLAHMVDDAAGGHGGLTLVEGPAGIGKSALVNATRDVAAKRGMRVLFARGAEREQDLAFGVVRQLFELQVAHEREGESSPVFAGAARLAMHALDVTRAPAGTGSDAFAVLHGLYWLTANLAERGPLLIAVDDVHWADAPSMRFVEYLHRRLEDLPTCVVAAARSEEAGPGHRVLDALRADAEVVRLLLSPLGEAAVGELAREELGDDTPADLVRAFRAATGGNPFYLRALLGAARTGGVDTIDNSAEAIAEMAPDAVRRSVLVRLERLGPDAVALAEALGILGAVSLGEAAHLAGLDAPTAEREADGLVAANLLSPGRHLEFIHPIVRSSVYGTLPAGHRSTEHRRAARMLAGNRADISRIAAHLLAVEPAGDEWMVEQLRLAADDATQRGAPDTAATYLRRALREPPHGHLRGAVLIELGSVLLRLGEGATSVELVTEALDLADGPEQLADAAIALRELLTYSGRPAEVVASLSPVVERLATDDPDWALEVELAMLASGILHETTGPIVAGRVRELGEEVLAGRLDHPHAVALVSMGLIFHGATPAASLSEPTKRAAECWTTLGVPEQRRFLNHLLPALISLELYETAQALQEPAIRDAQRLGSSWQFAAWLSYRSFLNFVRGSVLDAEADARGALEAVQLTGQTIFSPFARAWLMLAQLERGELEAADRVREESGIPSQPLSIMAAIEAWACMRVVSARGDLREAADGLLQLGEALDRMCVATPSFISWRSDAASTLLRLGDREQARALASQELELARTFGAPRPLGIALRTFGLVDGGDNGLELLREAEAVLRSSQAALEHARALVELGAALRRAGERREARDHLREGWDRARNRGATALADRAKEELAAAGGRPRRDALRGRDALTASELRIVLMAAAGSTNPEIAQSLFITRRTVETHLSAAYRKLDITSRAELPAALEA